LKRAYTIDPERACLPVVTENLDQRGRIGTMTVLGDLFHCAGRCWLPKTMIIYNAMNGTAKLMRLTGFEVGKKPALSDFRLEFDTKVVIPDSKKELVYENVAAISLRNRQALRPNAKPARFIKQTSASSVGAPAMPGEREGGFRYTVALVIGLGSAAVLACAFFIRKRWIG
jgi:hypothetical protein